MPDVPPPLPDSPALHKAPRATFDWKPYARALLWMFPALALLTFCSVILSPRLEDIWQASRLHPAKPVFAWMIATVDVGQVAAVVAIGTLGLVVLVAEGVLKGNAKVRGIGCTLAAFLTNLTAITAVTCCAIVLSVVTPLAQEKLAVYRRVAALAGTFDSAETLAHFNASERPARARGVTAAALRDIDSMERFDLLDASLALMQHADSEGMRRRALGQALALLEAEPDTEYEISATRVLRAAVALRQAPFADIDELLNWHAARSAEPDWPAAPLFIVE